MKYKDVNIEFTLNNTSIVFALLSISCCFVSDFIIISKNPYLLMKPRNIVCFILIEQIQILIIVDALSSLPLEANAVITTAKTWARWTIKYSNPTEGTGCFSHLSIFFIPHIEMASHFSVSPRTAGIYNSIKAHESIDKTSYTVAVYTSKPLVYFFEQYHQNQYIPQSTATPQTTLSYYIFKQL